MIVFGGGESNGGGYNGIVGLRYNPLTNRWATISSTDSPTLGSNLSTVWTGTDIIVTALTFTPYNNYSSVIWGYKYNIVTDTWVEISLNRSPKLKLYNNQDAGSIYPLWTGNDMIVLGSDYDGTLKGGRYDPASNTWNVISNPNFSDQFSLKPPPDNTNKIAFWTGSNIIFYDKEDLMSEYERI